jgi:hypothetical protein
MKALVGLGHLIGQIASSSQNPSEAEASVWEAMRHVRTMPGTMHTHYDFSLGDGIGMGVMYIAFGLLNVLVGRLMARHELSVPRSVLVLNTAVAWASFVIGALFFPGSPGRDIAVRGALFLIGDRVRPERDARRRLGAVRGTEASSEFRWASRDQEVVCHESFHLVVPESAKGELPRVHLVTKMRVNFYTKTCRASQGLC